MDEGYRRAKKVEEVYWNTPRPETVLRYYNGFKDRKDMNNNYEKYELHTLYSEKIQDKYDSLDKIMPSLLEHMEVYVELSKDIKHLCEKRSALYHSEDEDE